MTNYETCSDPNCSDCGGTGKVWCPEENVCTPCVAECEDGSKDQPCSDPDCPVCVVTKERKEKQIDKWFKQYTDRRDKETLL